MLQVLLVDDEIAVTDSMQRGIDWAALGLHVAAVAMSGMQALKFIHANPVDIVITDIRMADMDGLSLCQRIFQLNRNIQTIIVSGFAEFSYAQKALSYGVIGYCLKPIEYTELTRYLQLAIHRLGHYPKSSNFDDLLTVVLELIQLIYDTFENNLLAIGFANRDDELLLSHLWLLAVLIDILIVTEYGEQVFYIVLSKLRLPRGLHFIERILD